MQKHCFIQNRKRVLKMACVLLALVCVYDLSLGATIVSSLANLIDRIQDGLSAFVSAFEDATLARLGAPAQ
ncbi:hypothetical protein [Terasakiella pusilla]|uniref:hypothetical protein n=1 Tax=Terasakiella pusilla TaxID=64973 RepID=UPI00048BD05A|nr:hypothetical protein [Terasakiella pusilla]